MAEMNPGHGVNVRNNPCDRREPHGVNDFHTDTTTGINWHGRPPGHEDDDPDDES